MGASKILGAVLALAIAGAGLAKTWPGGRHRDRRGPKRAHDAGIPSTIEKYMGAMAMPFRVADSGELDGLYPGVRIEFDLTVTKRGSIARNIRKTGEPDAVVAPPKDTVKVGDPIPDFSLRGRLSGRRVRLADLRGKVIAIDFLYTRCRCPMSARAWQPTSRLCSGASAIAWARIWCSFRSRWTRISIRPPSSPIMASAGAQRSPAVVPPGPPELHADRITMSASRFSVRIRSVVSSAPEASAAPGGAEVMIAG